MSRGRHRHSSFLGRVLPPTAAGVLIVAAVAALLFSQDTVLVRSMGVAAVLAALGIAVLLRQRDRAARAAAEVSVAQRLRAEERFEEQLAEAEYAAEVAEERATRFGRRLTAEKSRLAKAETEIARLLRERAVMVAEQALKEAEAAQRALAASRPKYPASPAAFVRAASVLRQLERRAAAAQEQRERAAGAQLALRARTAPVPAAAAVPSPVVPAPVALAPERRTAAPVPAAPAVPAPATAKPAVAAPAAPVRPVLTATVGQLGGPPAVPVAPVERQRPRPAQPGAGRNFSFFGRTAGGVARPAAPEPAVGSVAELGERADLADVVGDEAVAAQHRTEGGDRDAVQTGTPDRTTEETAPEVVDLTPDDETELIQLPELRASR
ncbi:hypothetical protein [Kitasatospora sp. A2-31]|uniref:hypothetical protein n=1 Tax=Kitasatospora sp. A2-31 TaxID=2916414 RepID=UPI001EE9C90B|nr:hypothetical protein [Kitasatospora sp. A2-31]MCG6495034.1 hypothetical protein [Kitasatospora sp. A2-31]